MIGQSILGRIALHCQALVCIWATRGVHPTSSLKKVLVDVTMSLRAAILPRCSHVYDVKKDAVRVCELFEMRAHKFLPLIRNDHQRRTKILNPPAQLCTLTLWLLSCPKRECTIDTACPSKPCCRKRFWCHQVIRFQKDPHQASH